MQKEKRGPGRPPKPEHEKYTERVCFEVTTEQRELIRVAAQSEADWRKEEGRPSATRQAAMRDALVQWSKTWHAPGDWQAALQQRLDDLEQAVYDMPSGMRGKILMLSTIDSLRPWVRKEEL